jgi:Arc/MetJ-type ribon-helix-helix transcriptional regulator
MRNDGDFPSMASAVRDAIRIGRMLQEQAKQGYGEVFGAKSEYW